MIFHLFAVAACGFLAAGCLMLTVRCFGVKAPKFIVLLAAGIGMISYGVWEEYSWYDRNAVPMKAEGMLIVQTYGEGFPWQPWTYIYPRVTRFMAWKPQPPVKPTDANLKYGELHLVTRRADIVMVPQIYDCDQGLSAELVGKELAFDESNRPVNLRWARLLPDDPLYRVVCLGELPQ